MSEKKRIAVYIHSAAKPNCFAIKTLDTSEIKALRLVILRDFTTFIIIIIHLILEIARNLYLALFLSLSVSDSHTLNSSVCVLFLPPSHRCRSLCLSIQQFICCCRLSPTLITKRVDRYSDRCHPNLLLTIIHFWLDRFGLSTLLPRYKCHKWVCVLLNEISFRVSRRKLTSPRCYHRAVCYCCEWENLRTTKRNYNKLCVSVSVCVA